MPLRDHFHPPFLRAPWESVHGQLASTIAASLNRILPPAYVAGPNVSLGGGFEVDIGGFESNPPDDADWDGGRGSSAGTAVAVAPTNYAAPAPSLQISADWSNVDDFEVRIYDSDGGRELVAAIEIISPSNKDRLDHRRLFVGKCAALLQRRVSVTVLDFVTNRAANLYAELLEVIGQVDPQIDAEPGAIYAASLRERRPQRRRILETWYRPLAVGDALPTLPIWLSDRLAVPLSLESIYTETLTSLRCL